MRYLLDEQGITQFYEIGPGRVLCGLAEAHRPQSAVRKHRGVDRFFNHRDTENTESRQRHGDQADVESQLCLSFLFAVFSVLSVSSVVNS